MPDPNTPVLVGIGVADQRFEDPSEAAEPLALMIEAARRAIADCGAPGIAASIGRIGVPMGRWAYGDPARLVGQAIGARDPMTILAKVGVLQQTLLGDAARAVAEGETEAALVVGGDAGYRLLRAGIVGHSVTDRSDDGHPDRLLAPHEELRHPIELRFGFKAPVGLYAIIDSAFRFARGRNIETHRDALAALYAGFSEIAADNPHAWRKQAVPPDAIRGAAARNPMQAFPYTSRHCSSWSVDQASALLFCSMGLAERLGLRKERLIFPLASTEANHMVPVSARAELARCPGAAIAGAAALQVCGIAPEELDLVEFYSCFPVAVEMVAAELGVRSARSLTVTGGMPFAGGPYNNYVLQATCRMVELLRAGKGTTGLVGSISGVLTKQGFGVWSRQPGASPFESRDVTDAVPRAMSTKEVVGGYAGPATIAGYTVLHSKNEPPSGVILADLPDGRRTMAATSDESIVNRMEAFEFCGATAAISEDTFVCQARG
jgi:acetyl-CoA C-acetyltransferase